VIKASTLALVVSSVMLSSTAQLLLKAGATRLAAGVHESSSSFIENMTRIASSLNLFLFAGLASFTISLLLWLVVLSRLAISTAYPFVAGGIAITTIGGSLLFGEIISPVKWVVLMVIIVAVATLSIVD